MSEPTAPDTSHAQLRWDEHGQPLSTQFDDVYFSRASGLEETRYVFLQHNNLPQRWQHLQPGQVFTVAETGFGTGLNFLACWEAWQEHAPAGAHLHFVSVEKYPLSQADLKKALALWPELAPLAETLQEHYTLSGPGHYRWHLAQNVTLSLLIDDAISGFEALLPVEQVGPVLQALEFNLSALKGKTAAVDAWFLDGFAPAKNPGMWQPALFAAMARLSHPGTTLATFTAAGVVRRGLKEVGFEVHKTPGFGRKREMLQGCFTESVTPEPAAKPSSSWHTAETLHPAPSDVAIIGAGLAGAHIAHRLAQSGLKVTVIERGEVASGGSGNAQGALYTRLSAGGHLAQFNHAAFEYACHFYEREGLFAKSGAQCGLLQSSANTKEALAARELAQKSDPAFCRFVSPQEASTLAGVEVPFGGVYFPRSGWMNPARVCHSLLNHPNITLCTHTAVTALTQAQSRWSLETPNGRFSAGSVVVACAASATELSQCSTLPVRAIRGQVTSVSATPASKRLETVLCGKGYLPPADPNGEHCLGATFNLTDHSSEPNSADTATNLANANALSPELGFTAKQVQGNRANFRCTTPDYLPIAGPVADIAAMTERFAGLRRNYRLAIDAPGCYHPGLFICVGHGSRGLTYTPLCAELICNEITGQFPPLPLRLLRAIHPARFLIRDLGRNRA